MHKRVSDKDIDLRYPNHERVYRYLHQYGEARPDFKLFAASEEAMGAVDAPPLDWREDNPTADRCRWWLGTDRTDGQDTICILGTIYPVVVYFWELKYGNHYKAPIPGLPAGKKLVVRPICCHYTKVGICVNTYHYQVRVAGPVSPLAPRVLREVRSIWRENRIPVRKIAETFGLTEKRIYRIVKGLKRNAY